MAIVSQPSNRETGISVATVAGIPEITVAKIRRWCARLVPEESHKDLYVDYDVRGNSVTIVECRPPFDGIGDWSRVRIAQLRSDTNTRMWSLYWADQNDRWRPYEPLPTTDNLDDLLSHIDHDPMCVFWG